MEAITATISLIQEGILDKYEEESSSSSNQSLHNEIKYFRKLLNSIKGILQDIRQQLVVEQEKTDYNHKNNTSFLKRPLLLLDDAVKEGGQVLEECSRAKNLRVHIFSKTYLGKLNGASAKMKDAMQLLTAVDITLDGSIQENLKDLNDQFHLLQQTIQHHHHEVADLFVQQQQDAFQDGIIIRRLIDLDLGTSESDIQGQMQEIADRADELRREKTFVDDQILKRVQDMSLLVNRQYSLSSKSLLLCPISMEVMKDPVLLSPSGHTYDRESICQSLLIQPDVCPVTNKRYDKQLTFTSNIGLRQVLMATYGDSAYQSYDDTWFWPRYHALWKEKQQVHSHDLAYSSYPATGNMEDLYKRVEVLLYGLHRESINDKEAELLVNYHLSDSIMIAFKSFILWRRNKTDPAIDVFAKYALLQGLARISESGNRIAQNLLGNFYLNGHGVSQDYSKAMEWYQKAASQGFAAAQNGIGYIYDTGQGVSQDYSKAMEWYQKAASQGYAAAQCNIGLLYYDGHGVSQDYSKAMEWYQKAASQGYAAAQFSIGDLYEYSQGVTQDYSKAMEWYQKAASQGYAAAQFSIGCFYEYGLGVSQDYSKAMEWYQKAASQGYAAAQYNSGYLYGHGLGVSQDYSKAMVWYQKAASQGYAAAQFSIGYLYSYGLGVSQDYSRAMEWYQKAANQGYAAAQNNIGALYEYNLGVSQDYSKAIEWYQKAANQGVADAQISVERLKQRTEKTHTRQRILKMFKK